jgi:hypothetical protein
MYKTTREDREKETKGAESDVVKTANTTLILRFSLFRAPKLWSVWVPLQLPKAPIVYHDVRRELYLRCILSVPLHVCRRPPPAAEPSVLDVKVLWYMRY